jgi:RNA polymerase sigma-70 factor (ECF subfamily)
MVRNPTEAEDLTQEVFLQVFRKIHTFRNESAFSTWLHRLAVNVVLMRLRKKTLVAASLDEAAELNEETGRPPIDIGGRDLRLAGVLDRLNIGRALRQLPPGYRLIFVLHDVQGYEHNEIAEILGCSVGSSKSQLHKARRRLRQALQGDRPKSASQAGIPFEALVTGIDLAAAVNAGLTIAIATQGAKRSGVAKPKFVYAQEACTAGLPRC